MGLFRSPFGDTSPAAIHSNGFAEAADKDAPSFGSTSSESFATRREIDRSRQHIGRFQHARIHYDYRSPNTSNSETAAPDGSSIPASPPRPISGVPPRPAGNFREPSSRGFNPYR